MEAREVSSVSEEKSASMSASKSIEIGGEVEPGGAIGFACLRATSSRWIAASCCLKKNSFCLFSRDSATADETF